MPKTNSTLRSALGFASTAAACRHEPLAAVPQVGMVIRDMWTLSSFMGAGSFGVVYSAEHRALEREDAVKFLHPHLAGSPDLRARFRREAMTMAKLCGEHLVQVHDCGEHEGLPFFIMERLSGHPLDERLRRDGPVSLPVFHRLALEILRGLSELHGQGVVHRDIKPANIFVLARGERVKLLDFGLALSSWHATSIEGPAGTPYYMAPELVLCTDATASVSTDIFSVGVVLYQMLTGRLPFAAAGTCNLTEHARRAIAATPTPPRALRAEVPAELDDLVMRTIAIDPARRPATADELLAAIERCATSDRVVCVERRPRAQRRLIRGSLASAGVLGVVLVAMASSDVTLKLRPGTAAPHDQDSERFVGAVWGTSSEPGRLDPRSSHSAGSTTVARAPVPSAKPASMIDLNFVPTPTLVDWTPTVRDEGCVGGDCEVFELSPISAYLTKLDSEERVFGSLGADDLADLPVLKLDVVNDGDQPVRVSELRFHVLDVEPLRETILSAEYVETDAGDTGLILRNFGRAAVKSPRLDLRASLDCTDAGPVIVQHERLLDDFESSYLVDVRDDVIAALSSVHTGSPGLGTPVDLCLIGDLHYQTSSAAGTRTFRFAIRGSLTKKRKATRGKAAYRASHSPSVTYCIILDGTTTSTRSRGIMREIPSDSRGQVLVRLDSTIPAALHLRAEARDMRGRTLAEQEFRVTIRRDRSRVQAINDCMELASKDDP